MFLVLKEGIVNFYLVIKSIFTSIKMFKKVIVPAAKSTIEHKDTTIGIIHFFQQIGAAWSASLYKKIIQGLNALYNFFIN